MLQIVMYSIVLVTLLEIHPPAKIHELVMNCLHSMLSLQLNLQSLVHFLDDAMVHNHIISDIMRDDLSPPANIALVAFEPADPMSCILLNHQNLVHFQVLQ